MPKKKKSAGRKKVEFQWDVIDKMLQAGCSGASIASKFGVHRNTLYQAVQREFDMMFDEYSRMRKEEGNDMLRLKQFDIALKGDKGMLIWLGKQRLQQSEKVDNTHEHDFKKVPVTEVVVVRKDRE